MNAVVLTVKASYVASTKYPRSGAVNVSISPPPPLVAKEQYEFIATSRSSTVADRRLENESSREEASGSEGKAGGGQSQGEEGLAEETHHSNQGFK